MKLSSKPYYILPGGEPNYEIPGSAALKSVGGKVVVGKYHVSHRNEKGERFPWVVYEKTAIGTEHPVDDFIEIETHPQYREAIRHAAKLDRQHLASLQVKSQDKAA